MKKLVALLLTLALLLGMVGTTAFAADAAALTIPTATWTISKDGELAVTLSEGTTDFTDGSAVVEVDYVRQEVMLEYDETKKAFTVTDPTLAGGTVISIELTKQTDEENNLFSVDYNTYYEHEGKVEATEIRKEKISETQLTSAVHSLVYDRGSSRLTMDMSEADKYDYNDKGIPTSYTSTTETKNYDSETGKYTGKAIEETKKTYDDDGNVKTNENSSKTYNKKDVLVGTGESKETVTLNADKDARTTKYTEVTKTNSDKGYLKTTAKTESTREEKKIGEEFESQSYKYEEKTTNRDGILSKLNTQTYTYDSDGNQTGVTNTTKNYNTYTKAMTSETVITGKKTDDGWDYTRTVTKNNDDGSLRSKVERAGYSMYPYQDYYSSYKTETRYNSSNKVVATMDKDGTWKDAAGNVIGKNEDKDKNNYEHTGVSFKTRTGEISGYSISKSEEAEDGTVTRTSVSYSNGKKTTDSKTVITEDTEKRYNNGVLKYASETKDGVTENKYYDAKGNLSASSKEEEDTTTYYDYRGKKTETFEETDSGWTDTYYDPDTEKMTKMVKSSYKDGVTTEEHYGADSKLRWSTKYLYGTTTYYDANGFKFAEIGNEAYLYDGPSSKAYKDGKYLEDNFAEGTTSLEMMFVPKTTDDGETSTETRIYTKWDVINGTEKDVWTRTEQTVKTENEDKYEYKTYTDGVLDYSYEKLYNDYGDTVKATNRYYNKFTGKQTSATKTIYNGVVDNNSDDPIWYTKRYDGNDNLQSYKETDNTDKWNWSYTYYADGRFEREYWIDGLDYDSSYDARYYLDGTLAYRSSWNNGTGTVAEFNRDGSYKSWKDTADGVTNEWQYNGYGELTGYKWNQKNANGIESYDYYDAAGSLIYSFERVQGYVPNADDEVGTGTTITLTDPAGNKWTKHDDDVTLTLAKGGSGWQSAVGKWFYIENGKPVQDAWKAIDGQWYYFDEDGFMETGIFADENKTTDVNAKATYKTYALDGVTGALVVGGWAMLDDDGEDWAFTNANGEVVTGWQQIGGKWYYFKDGWDNGEDIAEYKEEIEWTQDGDRGQMVTGAAKVWNGDWTDKHTYFFNEDGTWDNTPGWKVAQFKNGYEYDIEYHYYDKTGKEVVGWNLIDGEWYYFNEDGVMKNGWVKSGNNWYFMDPKDGAMATSGWAEDVYEGWYYMDKNGQYQTGWLNDGGNWYYLKDDGAMASKEWTKYGGCWYYLGEDGAIETGWVQDHGSWYYMKQDGIMKTSGWVGEGSTWYYVGADGAMVADTDVTVDGKVYHFDETGLCTNP